jgi:hypothetical protein
MKQLIKKGINQPNGKKIPNLPMECGLTTKYTTKKQKLRLLQIFFDHYPTPLHQIHHHQRKKREKTW